MHGYLAHFQCINVCLAHNSVALQQLWPDHFQCINGYLAVAQQLRVEYLQSHQILLAGPHQQKLHYLRHLVA